MKGIVQSDKPSENILIDLLLTAYSTTHSAANNRERECARDLLLNRVEHLAPKEIYMYFSQDLVETINRAKTLHRVIKKKHKNEF